MLTWCEAAGTYDQLQILSQALPGQAVCCADDLDISSRRRNKPLAHAPIRTTGQAPKSVLNPGRRPLQFREF
jgi:hypothetical protein